ncbi:MAG: hypothetical protein R3F61_02405 [Myxococcota bacterium]
MSSSEHPPATRAASFALVTLGGAEAVAGVLGGLWALSTVFASAGGSLAALESLLVVVLVVPPVLAGGATSWAGRKVGRTGIRANRKIWTAIGFALGVWTLAAASVGVMAFTGSSVALPVAPIVVGWVVVAAVSLLAPWVGLSSKDVMVSRVDR